MINKYAYTILNLDFTAAKSDESVEIEGRAITYVSGSIDIEIKFDSRSNSAIVLSPKDRLRFPSDLAFSKFFITGNAGGGTVQLMVGKPDIMLDAGQVHIAGGINIAGLDGTPVSGVVAVNNTATLIKASHNDRASILVQNHDAANDLYIGYANTVTILNAGHIVKPFGSVELNAITTIYGIRAAGTGNAGYLEELT